jgi:hypothetical protein
MSFDVYLQFFHERTPAGVSPESVRTAFPVPIEVLDDDYWRLGFGAQDTTDLFLGPADDAPAQVHRLSFHRPCADARLWRGLWHLLEAPGAVLHFPGSAALVRHAAAGEGLPADLREALGAIVVVAGPEALQHAYAQALQQADGT